MTASDGAISGDLAAAEPDDHAGGACGGGGVIPAVYTFDVVGGRDAFQVTTQVSTTTATTVVYVRTSCADPRARSRAIVNDQGGGCGDCGAESQCLLVHDDPE